MRLIASLLCGALVLGAPSALHARERIVSIAGAITEIVHALGAGDDVVAVDTTSVHPPRVASLPKVGYFRQLSAEGILSMRPTLVVMPSDAGPPQAIDQLRAVGVKLAVVEDRYDAAGVAAKIRGVAAALGVPERGKTLARSVSEAFAGVASAVASVPQRPRVLFVLSTGRGAPMAAGRDTAADAVIRLAGGDNVVRGYAGYKPLSPEAATEAAPEIVLAMSQAVEQAGGAEAFLAQLRLGSTKTPRVVALDGTYLLGFGPRAPMAVADLARALHPGIALP